MVKFYYLLPILMVMLALIANHLKGELDMASFLFSKLSFLVVLDLFPNLSSSYDFISKAASADEKLLPSVYFKDIHLLGEEVFIRLYSSTPLDQQPPLSLRPILFFIHGGGFCLGSVGHENLLASTFALQANVIIVSVGYRLAPKHPFPIPVEDVWTAFEFVSRHGKEFGGDVSKISVMGESAGGTLAAGIPSVYAFYFMRVRAYFNIWHL